MTALFPAGAPGVSVAVDNFGRLVAVDFGIVFRFLAVGGGFRSASRGISGVADAPKYPSTLRSWISPSISVNFRTFAVLVGSTG